MWYISLQYLLKWIIIKAPQHAQANVDYNYTSNEIQNEKYEETKALGFCQWATVSHKLIEEK